MISPADAVINMNLSEQTRKVLKTLTPREEKVLRMRFGIGEKSDHTLEEVGQEVDLRAEYTWMEVQGGKTDSASGNGKECSDNDHVSYPPDSCSANWKHADSHDGSAGASHYFAAELWDVDSSGPNDLLHDKTGQRITWDTGVLTLHDDNSQKLLMGWPLNDNEPVSQCTGTQPVNMCFLTDPDELGPGQQF